MLKSVRRKIIELVRRQSGRILRFAFGQQIDLMVAGLLQRMRDESCQKIVALEDRIIADFSNRLLSMRDRSAIRWNKKVSSNVNNTLAMESRDLKSDLRELSREFPVVFPIWEELFENARREYDSNPNDSLSIEGNLGAEAFRRYVAPELRGRVLDIGCGPQSLPLYLRGEHSAAISGIDPLSGSKNREFDFVQGIGEFLPWPDGVFDVVTIGTSLDHAISLDRTFEEIVRVLAPGGVCIIWLGFIPGAPRYDPHDLSTKAIDAFHIFHFDRPWFLEIVSNYFSVLDEFKLDKMSYFYTLSPKGRYL